MIILLSVVIFVVFTLKQNAQSEDSTKSDFILTIGLYKANERNVNLYFSSISKELKEVLDKYFKDVRFKHFTDIDSLCKEINNGSVHIAGEFSPIEYIERWKSYRFKPLVGIEYNDKPFYHSVLFVPLKACRIGHTFEKKVGRDHLADLKRLLSKEDCKIVHLKKTDSTSGYYYPRSYLIDQDIVRENTTTLDEYESIFQTVLKKDPENKNIAGFMADFRLNTLTEKYFSEKEDAPKNAEYDKPLIIDKSDPIPNGVFVISNALAGNPNFNLKLLTRRWKSVRPVSVLKYDNDEKKNKKVAEISGWRTGVDRDLALVAQHKNKVFYYDIVREKYPVYLAITIAVLVIFLCLFSWVVIRRI